MSSFDRLGVAHIVTTFSLGGATENTLWSARGVRELGGYRVAILAGWPIRAEGGLLEEAEQAGIDVEIIDSLQRDINLIADVRALVALVWRLRKGRYAIVHTHGSKAGILGRLAARILGLPVVVHTFHSLPYAEDDPWWKRVPCIWLERLAARWSTGLLSVTQDVVDRIERDRIAPPGKCTVARSGMDLDRFLHPAPRRDDIRSEWGIPNDGVAVGMIGRVHTGKGQDVLVGLAPRLCRAVPTIHLIIIGTGPLREELAERVASLGLSDRVRLVGAVPPAEMPEAISALDVLLHMSEREGLARVIVQALACGRPAISYDLDGSPEVIADRVNGRLIRPGDADELVDAIVEIAGDAHLRASWGKNGPPAVDPGWRVETMVRQIDEAYRRYLSGSGLVVPPSRPVPPLSEWAHHPPTAQD